MAVDVELPNIFAYVDYRAFLRDHYQASKQIKPQYSFRFFARRAGLSSSNFLKLVMDGKRNLGAATIDNFIKGLSLADAEAAFFRDLVAFDQAETLVDKNRAFERLASTRRFRKARRLEGPLFKYLTRWYYPVVRELAGRPDFRDDPAWIAKQITPAITTRQARSALKTLRSLGLLIEDEDGQIVRGDTSLATTHEVRSVVVPAFHRQMIERAAYALEKVPPDGRDMTSITVCVRAKTLADLKERIRRFRESILELCDSEEDPEQVYQLCIQLFPMSRSPEASER